MLNFRNHARFFAQFKNNKLPLCIMAGLLLLVIASVIILACVPPVSRDALTHHLAVPKLYLNHGGIYQIPSIEFSYYPMNLDFLYLVLLYFGNDIIPKYIHFLFALLTAFLIYNYLQKRLGSIWGLLGALFFLSLPIIVKLSITVYVDLGLVFFSTAAIINLFKWIETRFQPKYLIVSAVFCGLALGTKYNGLLILFILATLIPFVYIISNTKIFDGSKKSDNKRVRMNPQLRAVGACAIFCTVSLLVFSPWMVRNYIWKGNPIYPLYKGFFSNASSQKNDDIEDDEKSLLNIDINNRSKMATRWGPLAIRKIIYGESGWEIALIPARIFFTGRDDDPKHFDGRLNPFLFLLPFFAFFRMKGESAISITERKILAIFIILYILYAFLQIDMRIRYIAPIIPPAIILSIFGLRNFAAALVSRWNNPSDLFPKACIVMVVGSLLGMNAAYIFKQFGEVKPFNYLSGRVSRDEYIAEYRPEYRVIQYANQNLPNSSKILALFLGNRGYYSNREIIFGNEIFKKVVKTSQSPGNIKDELLKMGVSHLFIRYDLFNFWAEKQFSAYEKKILAAFFDKALFRLQSQAGYGLFKLV